MESLREKIEGIQEDNKKDKENAVQEIKEFYEKQIFDLCQQIKQLKDKNGEILKAQKRAEKLAKQKEGQGAGTDENGKRKVGTGAVSPDQRPY